jgi:hypothetical protein
MKPWKMQKFFGDVVYDLRNKGLLPVVILLLVAMVAVPILVSRGGSGGSSASLQSATGSVKPAPEGQTAVVTYEPGVRDYTKRLDGQSPKDPFEQKFAESAAAAADLDSNVTAPTTSGGSSSGVSSSGGATGPTTSTVPGSSGSGGSSGGSGGGNKTVRYFYSVADISAGDVTQPLQRHKKLKPFAPLPSQVAPVVIYLGASLNGKHAYFSISKLAEQPTGEGTCAPSPTDCSLLALAAGQAEDFVYTVDGKTYRVKVNKINRVVTRAKPSGSSSHGTSFRFTK